VSGESAASIRRIVRRVARVDSHVVSAPLLFEPNWLVSYTVDVIDATGHEISGIAYATGFIRRKAWIDW
jgi:hypothetical protein